MAARFYKLLLNILNWEITNEIESLPAKYIVIIAPHTSFWDFIIGWLGFRSLGIKPRIMIKKEFFKFPIGLFLKSIGCIPVDRKSGNSVVNQIVGLINKNENIVIAITPEGTRKYVERWKRGFLSIANKADIPIAIGYLDYKYKRGGMKLLFNPSENDNEDLKRVQNYYRGINAKYPENFNLTEN